ncbi:hypothetical protein HNQ80_004554 [Anaerosolibacter carboniphilus]|uniref:Uncharacterized protein n=1 Tax=Anaerosolibacter carboniphilus TaxID=1417629 RepID=A0A841L2I9_9FIRM|nr:DUF5946 family protein [Anaerosolibacter carboniphilus]MBB6218390.1 hypothetical protein [Anaerosolibacter carboniphilus]
MLKINDKFEKSDLCSECGAPLVDNMNCWEQLDGIIAWEYDYPELFAEHFKTVACYNLQHPAQFSDEAIAGLKTALIEHLDKGLSVGEIRRRNGKLYEGNRRVLKDIRERCPVQRKWKMTISDVYIPDCPERTAERVRKWAVTIREEL